MQPLAIQAILVVISIICLFFSPETPRYLVEKGRPQEAAAVLTRLYGPEYAAEAVAEIQAAVNLEHAVAVDSWTACFEKNDQCFRYRTMCAIMCNFFQQATSVVLIYR